MKYLETRDNIKKMIELKNDQIKTMTNLKATLNRENCDYLLIDSELQTINLIYLLVAKKDGNVITSGTKTDIKMYVSDHGIEINKIFGKELIFDTIDNELKVYDDFIKLNHDMIRTYQEMYDLLTMEDSLYILRDVTELVYKQYELIDVTTKEVLVHGAIYRIKNFIKDNNIDIERIFNNDELK